MPCQRPHDRRFRLYKARIEAYVAMQLLCLSHLWRMLVKLVLNFFGEEYLQERLIGHVSLVGYEFQFLKHGLRQSERDSLG